MNKGNCICCGENQTKIGWAYCQNCIDNMEDEDEDFDEERFEENRIEEKLSNCSCGAYCLSNDGKLIKVADCCC
jgi:hypothetical protein